MRAFLWRHRFSIIVLQLLLALCALVLLLIGQWGLGQLFMAGWMLTWAAKELIDLRRKPAPAELTAEELATLRAERTTDGETAAVRMLRAAYPDIGLLEAAARIRTL